MHFQIEIRELDDFAQAAFRGYKSLNRIQSRIYQTVYGTNENILVSDLWSSLKQKIMIKYAFYLTKRKQFAFSLKSAILVLAGVCPHRSWKN